MLQIISSSASRLAARGALWPLQQAAIGALQATDAFQQQRGLAGVAGAAVESSSSNSSSGDPSISSAAEAASLASSSRGWLRPPSGTFPAYEVSLLIKGFELRFVKQASTVIRDLMLLCFSPKSVYELPEDVRGLGSVKGGDNPVALAVPLGDRRLPTQRTLYTVIRSPHVHKTSREQFQRLVHRRLIKYPTNSKLELEWFLDALKTYSFTGVQIHVRIGSTSYLVAPQPDGAAAAASPRPLLADHMARFPHLFPAAAAAPSSGGGGRMRSAPAARMASDFDALRAAARAELLSSRAALNANPQLTDWLRQQSRESLAAAAEAAAEAESARGTGPHSGGLAAIGRAVSDEMAAAGEEGPLEDALAAAAQRVLADRGLPGQLTSSPSRHAAVLLSKLPLADLRGQALVDAIYGALAEAKQRSEAAQQQQQQGKQQQQGGAAAAVDAYAETARALVGQLLALWWQTAEAQLRGELALPPAQRAAAMAASAEGGRKRDAAAARAAAAAAAQAEEEVEEERVELEEDEEEEEVVEQVSSGDEEAGGGGRKQR